MSSWGESANAVRGIATLALVLLVGACSSTSGSSHGTSSGSRDSRLSSAVAVVSSGSQIESFTQAPGRSFVEAYVRFDSDLPDDVIFGLDQEFVDGVEDPYHAPGGDWMSFIGLQRTGAIWVAGGTDGTLANTPSSERSWEILDLGHELDPDTWYRIRIEADFGTRHFLTFLVEGGGVSKSFDLSEISLDYPNVMPFNDRAMTFFVFAMRAQSLKDPSPRFDGDPIVYFDDVSGGPVLDGGDVVCFESSFEEQQDVTQQPAPTSVIDLEGYEQGRWYLEREESLFSTQEVPFARTLNHVGVADASID